MTTKTRRAYPGETIAYRADGATLVFDHTEPHGDDWGRVVMPDGTPMENRPLMSILVRGGWSAEPPTMLKHGDHDQRAHGNWARGGLDIGVAESILADVKAQGGLSVSMIDGSKPTSGYMVAIGGATGSIASADDFFDSEKGPQILGDYFKEHKTVLSSGNYLGLWHNENDGNVYLDLSQNVQNRSEATRLGRERDQISIWDVVKEEEIDTGGTGKVDKSVADGEVAGHLEDDRRGDRRIRKDAVGENRAAAVIVRFEPGLRPVLKHGSHDQSSHGNWARSGRSDLTRKPGGGFGDDSIGPGGWTRGGRLYPKPDPVSDSGAFFLSDADYARETKELEDALFGDGYDTTQIRWAVNTYYDAKEGVQRKLRSIAERLGIREPDPPELTKGEKVRLQLENWAQHGAPSGIDSLEPPAWIKNDPAFADYVAPPLPARSRGMRDSSGKTISFSQGPTGGLSVDRPELQRLLDEYGTTGPRVFRPGDDDPVPLSRRFGDWGDS